MEDNRPPDDTLPPAWDPPAGPAAPDAPPADLPGSAVLGAAGGEPAPTDVASSAGAGVPVAADDPFFAAPIAPAAPAVALTPTYAGNDQDFTAFVAMLAGVGSLVLSCIPGASCVAPVVGLVAGAVALRNADRAMNPGRARMHAWLGIGSGALFVCVIVTFLSLYGAVILAALSNAGR